ncbi:MAG: glycerol-3-phosphate dehydrogenase/oxidase [Actinobacteria bacterium]|nr:glycerol-3-phosphate dehydrogenase/oxidase [Actinomycetota bacterium]
MKSPLDARAASLERAVSSPADLVVVGGGINGVGIALDAAARGLRTVLVERDDLAVGTSSRSSKLIHGGLRYLEHHQFHLVREALGERHLLRTTLAPHLVHIERFLFPVDGNRWLAPYIATGLTLYDLLGGRRSGRFRLVSRAEACRRVPGLREERLRVAFEYSDGVVDDARYVVAVARTAARLGATLLTRCEVVEWTRSEGRVTGVVARDRLDGSEHTIAGRVVIDATGAFEADDWSDDGHRLRPSRGIHLVVPRSRVPSDTGLTIRVPGRVVFLIPWGSHWLIGTTDVPHEGPVDRPTATGEEVSYLIDTLSRVLDVHLTAADIVATFAGVRPLVGAGDDTSSISREEVIDEPEPGRITVRGGKFTTYRRVAGRTLDRASGALGRICPSSTARLPLVGAAPSSALAGVTGEVSSRFGLDRPSAQHLVSRYGTEALDVARIAIDEGLGRPLVSGLPYLQAEAWWAVHHEQALSVDDVLSRRTRIAIEDPHHGEVAAETVAGLLGEALGWDSGQRSAAVDEYVESVCTEYGVPGKAETPEVAA